MTHLAAQFSSSFDQALAFASLVHDGVKRRGTAVPYMTHPVHVARVLEQYHFSEDVILAGLLHDVLEAGAFGDPRLQAQVRDTFSEFADAEPSEAAFRDAAEAFMANLGHDVLGLVRSVTEGKGHGAVERDWRTRKEEQLEHIPKMSRDQAGLKAADALHNCRSSLRDVRRDGLKTLRRFKGAVENTLWYLRASTDALRGVLAREPLQLELDAAASEFIAEVGRRREREAVDLVC